MRVQLTAVVVIGAMALGTGAWTVAQINQERERSVSPFQRRAAPREINPTATLVIPQHQQDSERHSLIGAARFPDEYRTIDGYGNNPMRPEAGAAGVPFLRLVPSAYGDGIGDIPARMDGPNVRDISNTMCAQDVDMPNPQSISDYLWQWGQFLDHDINETPLSEDAESFDIQVPMGDEWFDPFETGTVIMDFDRSAYTMESGTREQINHITAFIDGSNVYGSEHDRAEELRLMDGSGKLKTSAGNLMPFNTNGFPNADDQDDPSLFLAGDVRANEQAGLAAIHTLFVREHNYWAEQYAQRYPRMSGDELYETARAIVAAQQQAITYNEFLPVLLGPDALPAYDGYDPSIDPGISNVFATAAYRVGHTMLSSTIRRVNADGSTFGSGDLGLRDAFFASGILINDGITPIMRGLASQRAQIIDGFVIDDVRNFLFGFPGAGGFDLASLNMQRGRDHGLGSYNDVREAFGLPRAVEFTDINPDPTVAQNLSDAYNGDIEMVDPWMGMLEEPHVEGALVGETLKAVLTDQFVRLRDGDRFWYRAYLPESMWRMVDRQTLGVIIRRCTDAGSEVPRDVFRVQDLVNADWDDDGTVSVKDLRLYIRDWRSGDADVTGEGKTNTDDLLTFFEAWSASY